MRTLPGVTEAHGTLLSVPLDKPLGLLTHIPPQGTRHFLITKTYFATSIRWMRKQRGLLCVWTAVIVKREVSLFKNVIFISMCGVCVCMHWLVV